MLDRFTLTGPVAETAAIDPDDIVRAKSALSELGLFRGPVLAAEWRGGQGRRQ